MVTFLKGLGYDNNRKRIQRLMRLMGLEAIYPKPKTSKPHPGLFRFKGRIFDTEFPLPFILLNYFVKFTQSILGRLILKKI